MIQTDRRPFTALFFRSLALYAILYQFRFLAADLADTTVFSVTLIAAFASALFLARLNGKMRALASVVTIALIPWIVRAFIAVPRLLIPDIAVSFDSLLLNFDRNNFVSLLPFYWAAVTTWFSIRSRPFLRAAVIADAVLLIIVFGFTRVSDMAIYRWPIVMIVLLAGIIFLQALALLFSLPPETRLRQGEKFAAIAALLILIFIGGFLFLKPSQERAAQKGGGLLEPKLFSFDFSQFLRLDTEISMSDDLILIVKKDANDDHILLRRSVMSGYNKKQGFYRVEELDERTHPQRLSAGPERFSPAEFNMSREVYQEYYLVNFDAAAFIGMKEPLAVTPYESWDSSSFKSAYSVESLTSDFNFDDYLYNNMDTMSGWPGSRELGLTEKEFSVYTAYGEDERLRALAEEITGNYERYEEKVWRIHDYLKYGDYRYSLKPGIAPDGDQLAWFLFQSKKGYCSYYAFAMALMLRSLGIPARVTAGFFIDPESGAFDYYPVRSDMAHAWVEVPFPGYGWIEFDPTSQSLAEDEEFRFSAGVDPELFARLMREILENRSRLRVKTGQGASDAVTGSDSLAQLSIILLKRIIIPLLILTLIVVFVLIRCGYLFLSVIRREKRSRAVCLWKHARRRLRLAGLGCPPTLPESEWALRRDALIGGTYAMYLGAAAARFAPDYTEEDFISLRNEYRNFSDSYRKTIPLLRRLLAWICPPVALAFRLALILLFGFLITMDGRAQDADIDPEINIDADRLFSSAIEAEHSEFWERAIDLYREGSATYPQDLRFPRALGNLYYSRSLYSLAWDEYVKAEQIDPFDTYILHRMADTAGSLNRDRTSVTYLERLLEIDPYDINAIGDLGWMYFKVHRLRDGERLLTEALELFGDDANLAVRLANIYSDMYLYDEGKHWYEKSIELGAFMRSFTAVAHYNLSILESRFYHYDLSMDRANSSLDTSNRASGLLMRGELYMRQLDLEKALADFQDAREIDSSPLAKLSLAQTYQISGRLEEARLYALDCLKTGDNSWMLYYGIDPIRFKRDIHEILYKTYSGLANAERFVPYGTLGAKISSTFRIISFRFYFNVHRKLFQKYSLAAGDAYAENIVHGPSGVPPIDQYLQYCNAFEPYARRAITYLNRARELEFAIIPPSAASYNVDTGVLLKDKNLIMRALGELDPVWERDLISDCYRELALHGPKNFRRTAAEELFALNRGALLQEGISLPVEINLHYSNETNVNNLRRGERTLYRTLAKAGFTRQNNPTRFRLDLSVNESPNGTYAISCILSDTEGAEKPLSRVIPLRSLSRKDICAFAGSLSGFVFRVE